MRGKDVLKYLIILLAMFLATSVHASTWSVEKNGSGDYSVIQDAVNASASGDTILVGPGRYDDTVTFTNPYVTWTVCVVIPGSDLTFIGAGRDVTFIGPAIPGEMTDDGWRGFINWPMESGRLVIEDVTIENVFLGLQIDPPSLTVSECRFSNCYTGITATNIIASLVENCEFIENGTGIDYSSCVGPIIGNCTFTLNAPSEYMVGVYMRGVSDFIIEDCNFHISNIYIDVSTGTIRRCSLLDCYNSSIWLPSPGRYTIEDNEIDGSNHNQCIHLSPGSEVVGSGNILRHAMTSAIRIGSTHATFTGNHIFSNADFVKANGYSNPPMVELDFRNNYWGTSDPAELDTRIIDGYDDPSVYAHVLYEPYSNVPMSNEERSWGEIKALYK